MDPARQKRQEEITKALTFIQSSLAYPEPDGYQDFLTKLVCNLLDEGNAFFRDEDWEQAVRQFTEALNVSSYAEAEEIQIPEVLLESLYVNRAAAYHSKGEYERGVKDCDRALTVCKESRRALFRKALCLKELRKYKEAYNCTTDCLLINRLDQEVNDLAQELAVHLKLKNRKPYVAAKEGGLIKRAVTNGNTTVEAIKVSSAHVGNGLNPLSGCAPVSFPSMPQSSVPSRAPSFRQPAVASFPEMLDNLDDTELMGDDLDRLLDDFPEEHAPTETLTQAVFPAPRRTPTSEQTLSFILPAPTPQLPPAFFSSSVSELNSLDSFCGVISTNTGALDALDHLLTFGISISPELPLPSVALDGLDDLDCLDDLLDNVAAGNESICEVEAGEKSLDDLLDELDELDPLKSVCVSGGQSAMEELDSLDALDLFPSDEGVKAIFPPVSFGAAGLDTLSDFSSTGISGSHAAAAPVMRSQKNTSKATKEKKNPPQLAVTHPLSSTHEFLQACTACFPQRGQSMYSFVHKPDLVHSCKGNMLLCRRRTDPPSEWTRVRQIPNCSFKGPFVLCRELLSSGDLGRCKFGEDCTFAYNQLEIDVWMEERKGTLDRQLLFETERLKLDPVDSILHLLKENKGVFVFLCQECYDGKPRIISNRCRDNRTTCSNLDAHHTFDANKCLAFVMRTHSVNYRKVRPLSILCSLDLCRHAIRYGCQREDSCCYAHSVIELKTWRVQRDTGISPDEIVKISTKYAENQEQISKQQNGNRLSSGGVGGKPKGGKSLNMNMKFVCARCWADRRIGEPDKALKYCSAKARHLWSRERSVLLVKSLERSKWVEIRPLPHAKNFPVYYDICTQILEKKKCNYTGKCTFAHSPEEKDMWMYMKNNDLHDMQQMYDMWLSLTANNHQANGAALTQSTSEEKYIVMPTDYAEPMTGLYCRLCGRHSNGERQWQQHISSEKHKDRVFSCEGEEEALTWNYRFPGLCFDLCPKLDGGCPEGVSCDFAHSMEELQEWTERRDFLRQKLAKAREDMLVMPDEFDFGKFNFLLQD
ncbi:zinc finger CCCH domain-containing protein 7B-like [Trematomus bernacchii]|uniref:zinc finger CCCH domain-containing protein 7B-like n=1 Tax=Trematomus bernacchii TaxID=40690 RepID=UPI001469C49D|nr:zinc finger CCCH domain-containing protein 7B-like [Trematomus bernacchii]